MTAAFAGLRKGELVALRWRDVDWQAGRIRVRRNYTRGEFGTPKSRRSTRTVPLTARLTAALRQLHGRTAWRAADDLVFAHPTTLIYADHAPAAHEAEMIERAFGERDDRAA